MDDTKRGGARSGAGRPKGGLAKKSRSAILAAQAGGAMPREVLLEAMRYHHSLAIEAPKAEKGPHYAAAADMATRVAPYVHARLSSSEVTVRRLSEMTDDELDVAISDAESAAAEAGADVGSASGRAGSKEKGRRAAGGVRKRA
jgi:hypothetical protein